MKGMLRYIITRRFFNDLGRDASDAGTGMYYLQKTREQLKKQDPAYKSEERKFVADLIIVATIITLLACLLD